MVGKVLELMTLYVIAFGIHERKEARHYLENVIKLEGGNHVKAKHVV
jgi:hypothetical protein